MSTLLDASGQPIVSRDLTDQQLLAGFQHMDSRLNLMTQQVTHLGLFAEFLYEQVAAATDADGNPLVTINMEEFEAWAQARYQEIQEQVEAQVAANNSPEINLDETAADTETAEA